MQKPVRGFPSITPLGYPNNSFQRVTVRADVRRPDGRLAAEKGATGIKVASEGEWARVLFDEGQERFIEPAGCGSLIQTISLNDLAFEQVSSRVHSSDSDTPSSDRDASDAPPMDGPS